MQVYTSSVLSPLPQQSVKLKKLRQSKFFNPVKIEDIKNILELSLNRHKNPKAEFPEPNLKILVSPSPKPPLKIAQTKSNFKPIRIQRKKNPLANFQSSKSTSLHPVLQIFKSSMQPRYSFISRSKEIYIPEVKTKRNQVFKPDSLSSSSSDIENFCTMYH